MLNVFRDTLSKAWNFEKDNKAYNKFGKDKI